MPCAGLIDPIHTTVKPLILAALTLGGSSYEIISTTLILPLVLGSIRDVPSN